MKHRTYRLEHNYGDTWWTPENTLVRICRHGLTALFDCSSLPLNTCPPRVDLCLSLSRPRHGQAVRCQTQDTIFANYVRILEDPKRIRTQGLYAGFANYLRHTFGCNTKFYAWIEYE